jgi:hypothetical protein
MNGAMRTMAGGAIGTFYGRFLGVLWISGSAFFLAKIKLSHKLCDKFHTQFILELDSGY